MGRLRGPTIASIVASLIIAATLPVWAQQDDKDASHNERKVEKRAHALDRSGIWMLDFNFKDPRLITVDIPGRGRRNVWYLWYQVSNGTGEPRTFVPTFVWVCHDEIGVHHDQVRHTAQRAIQRIEDPTNLFDIKNSVTISANPIPVSKEFDESGMRIAYPKLVTGVAMWDDINPKCDRFSIFVYGLSDGWSLVDGPDGKPITRRKTLQLKFQRLGDEHFLNSREIHYKGHEWIYATMDPATPAPEPKKDDPATSGQKDSGR